MDELTPSLIVLLDNQSIVELANRGLFDDCFGLAGDRFALNHRASGSQKLILALGRALQDR